MILKWKLLGGYKTAINALKKVDIDVNEMAQTMAHHLPILIAMEFNTSKNRDVVSVKVSQ